MNSVKDSVSKVIHVDNLTVQYGETIAISNVTFDVLAGDYLGIIGPNGGGKSTLLKAILGLITPSSGYVEVFGQKPLHAGKRIGYVPQSSMLDRHFPITVKEVVLTGFLEKRTRLLYRYSGQMQDQASEYLKIVGLSERENRMVSDLSGGEFQKLLIARALAVEPELMILDEPTASVDANARNQIFELMAQLNQKMTILLVTHDLMAISSEVRSLACINNILVHHGQPEMNDQVVHALYGCPVDLLAHGVPHRVLRDHNHKTE